MKHTKTAFSIFSLLILGSFLFIWLENELAFREQLKERSLPSGLHPIVEEKRDLLVNQAAEIGINILITDGYRSPEEQDGLHSQGRNTPGSVVTHAQAGESYHNYGLAIDYALRLDDGSVVWDTTRDGNGNGESDWFEVAAIGKGLGFDWGGDWQRFKDYPHLEMTFGLSIRELQQGWRPEDKME
ncbi:MULTISPECIES: M15 family metallopeptidase [Planococcus]|uniref:Peptidase n=1 Tax=Planococcus faecalis TaxID=1598147 RepID=A0ABM6IPP0_9BACL|nr:MULTISPECIES: M15 family metallopeptidase [Planococcus]AQU78184.1 peptidase [Planococcus faecalis]MDJ0331179.1 M15 family metallopeptidase [Planococcus sp. S3-L1]OHX53784.1 peptidase [Planococcus faecalis]